MTETCKRFLNLSNDSYKPLACKPLTVVTEEIGGRGLENKFNYFFLAKSGTIKEHATLDVILPIPAFIRNARNSPSLVKRITTMNQLRITTDGKERVTA